MKAKRRRPTGTGIPDSQLVEFAKLGTLCVENLESENPQIVFRGRPLAATLRKQGGRGQIHGGYRYSFTLRYQSNRRTITRSRLIWMIVNKQEIGDGYELHHKDENRLNDAYSNLEKMSREAHAFIHYTANDDNEY